MEQLSLQFRNKPYIDERQLFLPNFGILKGYGRHGCDLFYQPSSRLRDINDQIINDPKFKEEMRKIEARHAHDWNLLANQVVGAEVF